MRRGGRVAIALSAWLAGSGASVSARADEPPRPASLRPWISLRFPGTPWVTTGELARWLEAGGGDAPVLLDAREPAEFAVSRLRGARRVDPASDALDPPGLPRGARIVVYCAVGYRSAAVVRRLRGAGFERVWNLEGGIFQWANEARTVFRDDEPVTEVHPFDARWGRWLAAHLHGAGAAERSDPKAAQAPRRAPRIHE